jgi:trimethylamine--corrinoid protein Co-methyltransferase
MIDTYVAPPLDPDIKAALEAYVAEKKASMPDSFM